MCECQHLTVKEAQHINAPYSVGYVHGRLRRKQHSGLELYTYITCMLSHYFFISVYMSVMRAVGAVR